MSLPSDPPNGARGEEDPLETPESDDEAPVALPRVEAKASGPRKLHSLPGSLLGAFLALAGWAYLGVGSFAGRLGIALVGFALGQLAVYLVTGGEEQKQRKLLLPVGLIAGTGTLVAVVLSFASSTIYSIGVDELVGNKGKWTGRTVRVDGTLVRGTLKFREKPCEYQFDATKGGQTLHVRYPACIKPDTLRDDMPDVGVTAEGKLEAGGEFLATNVLAKCPSKYEMKDKAKQQPGANAMPGGPPAQLP